MTHRAGLTLTEVLIAIFVTAVGMLSLLTLFPAGAQNMGRAIQDTRIAHSKENVTALAHAYQIQNDTVVQVSMMDPAVLDPSSPLPGLNNTTTGASYPVFVDPYGYESLPPSDARGGNPKLWVAGERAGVPRRSLEVLNMNRTAIIEATTFLDDLNFDKQAPANPLERKGEYSWAWMVQKSDANGPIANLSVIVYKGRPIRLGGGDNARELSYRAFFHGGQPVIDLQYDPAVDVGKPKPEVSSGMWVLDSTMTPQRYGQFYRVVKATPVNATTTKLEVQNPIFTYGGQSNPVGHSGTVVLMPDVADVFEKGSLPLGSSGPLN